MNSLKIILVPPLFGAGLGFPIIFILAKIGFFDELSLWIAGATGFCAAIPGLIIGFYILYKNFI